MMDLPAHVRSAWGAVQTADSAQPISGGLSSSRVWRIQSGSKSFALKANSSAYVRIERVEQLHAFQRLLNRTCDFVPQLQKTHTGETIVQAEGCLWELSSWLDGNPVEVQFATMEHGQAAMMTLAKLHLASQSHSSCQMPIPAVSDRIHLIHRYQSNRMQLGQSVTVATMPSIDANVRELGVKTLQFFDQAASRLLLELNNIQQSTEIFFVLRDIHREHMLFDGTRVTGVIDFGAARLDHPLVDLVRWLGTVYPMDVDSRHLLLKLYSQVTNRAVDQQLFRTLDHASTLLSAMQWLQWLIVEQKQFSVAKSSILSRWSLLTHRLQLNDW